MRTVLRMLVFVAALLMPAALGLRASGMEIHPALSPPERLIDDNHAQFELQATAVALRACEVEYLKFELRTEREPGWRRSGCSPIARTQIGRTTVRMVRARPRAG